MGAGKRGARPVSGGGASAVRGLVCSVLSASCSGTGTPSLGGPAAVSSSGYWIEAGAREAPPPPELPDQTRNYLDPWDLENYAYLRRHSHNHRRRSVAFDDAVHYASYSEDAYGPLSLDEGHLHEVVYEEPSHYHCPYHQIHYREYRDSEKPTEIEAGIEALWNRVAGGRRANFRLGTLGHLRIDYSSNWNRLDRFIAHR